MQFMQDSGTVWNSIGSESVTYYERVHMGFPSKAHLNNLL